MSDDSINGDESLNWSSVLDLAQNASTPKHSLNTRTFHGLAVYTFSFQKLYRWGKLVGDFSSAEFREEEGREEAHTIRGISW